MREVIEGVILGIAFIVALTAGYHLFFVLQNTEHITAKVINSNDNVMVITIKGKKVVFPKGGISVKKGECIKALYFPSISEAMKPYSRYEYKEGELHYVEVIPPEGCGCKRRH